MRHRVHEDHELGRQLQRQEGLLARRKLDCVESDFLEKLLEVFRDIDAGAPKYLTKVFRQGKLMRIVRCDLAHPPADRKCHLDHLVERRSIPGRT